MYSARCPKITSHTVRNGDTLKDTKWLPPGPQAARLGLKSRTPLTKEDLPVTLLGYARVSTLHQSPDMQIKALTEAGTERIWTERMSGAHDDRPELAALLDYARRGDVLMVWRLDRLGRSLPHLLTIASDLQDRGIELRSLTEAIDTTTAGGRLIFHVFGAVAEFERAIAAERTAAGVAAARAAGRPGLTADTAAAVQALDQAGTPRARSPAPSASHDPASTAASSAPVTPRRATHRARSTDTSICRSPTRSTIRCPRRK